jgi:hypothetical protein
MAEKQLSQHYFGAANAPLTGWRYLMPMPLCRAFSNCPQSAV